MGEEAFEKLSREAVASAGAAQVRLRFLRIAGGNAELARQLRGVAWQEYCAADRPFGASEEGMLLWLAYEQHGHPQ